MTRITPEIYEKLQNRGWMRSGYYFYLPNNETSCCLSIACRIDVTQYGLKNKRMGKKWWKFLDLLDNLNLKELEDNYRIRQESQKSKTFWMFQGEEESSNSKELFFDNQPDEKGSGFFNLFEKFEKSILNPIKKYSFDFLSTNSSHLNNSGYSTNSGNSGRSLSFLSNEPKLRNRQQLKITPYRIVCQKLEIEFAQPDSANEEIYELYRSYSKEIHKEEITDVSQFERFLVQTPLEPGSEVADSGLKRPLGTFHMLYRYDGQVIAVGVVDITPTILSSVYFFYLPFLREINLGINSIQIELQYLRSLNENFPDFKFYNPGYIVPNNPKMSYKLQFDPVQILNPRTWEWETYQKVANLELVYRELLNSQKTPRFSQDRIEFIKSEIKFLKNKAISLFDSLSEYLKEKFLVVLLQLVEGLGVDIIEELIFEEPDDY